MYCRPLVPIFLLRSGSSARLRIALYKLFAVLGFHKNAGAGLFDNLAGLPVDRDDDRPFARHVFEKLGGNHRLEQLGFFQHDQAEIGSRNIGGNPFPRLLAEELNVG